MIPCTEERGKGEHALPASTQEGALLVEDIDDRLYVLLLSWMILPHAPIAPVVTIISSFLFPLLPPKATEYFICRLNLIVWYRQGDLEPKFRSLIYCTLCSIALLCICANLYFHDVDETYETVTVGIVPATGMFILSGIPHNLT